jgi:hypothetical protein
MCPVCVARALTSSVIIAGPAGSVAAVVWNKVRLKKKEKQNVVRRDA